MTREQAVAEIKQRIRCADLLERSPSRERNKYCCPFCGSGTGNNKKYSGALEVFESTNTWCCYACPPVSGGKPKTGDVIDIYMKNNGVDFNTAVSLMAQQIGITIDPYNQVLSQAQRRSTETRGGKNTVMTEQTASPERDAELQPQEDFTEYYNECRKRIHDPAAEAYLKLRGISIANAERYWLGFDPAADPANAPGAKESDSKRYKPYPTPRIVFPCGSGYYVARRIDSDNDPRYSNPKGAIPTPFNWKSLYDPKVQYLFVLEGAFDAMAVIEAGEVAIAINSATNGRSLTRLLKEKKTDALLILCFDNDKNERAASNTNAAMTGLQISLRELGIRCITSDINGRYKDANEALCNDREAFIDCVRAAGQQAMMFLEQERQAAHEAEMERKQRTGASMMDSFLTAVRTKKYEPLPTGISDIDKAIGGGFIRQQIILLGAAPGAGKTALAQWIFEGMAQSGHACVYLNLEMSREQILSRSLSRIARKNGDELKPTDILQGYKWSPQQEKAILSALETYKAEIAPRMIYNPDEVSADLDSILAYIEQEAKRAENAGMETPIVVLDYLQIVRGREREDDTAIIKRAMECLKKYAIEHNTIVFVIMAHNRNSNRSGDVAMESGRDTSALEYGADLQLGLAYTRCIREPKKSVDELTQDERAFVTLKILKSRWGETTSPSGGVDLHFDGKTMTYTQVERDPAEVYPQKGNGSQKFKPSEGARI